MFEYPALVTRVVDSDTLRLQIDCGFCIHCDITVRLAGLNCPERNTVKGKAAAQFTADWLAKRLGKITVRTVKDKTEKYGRYLAHVWDIEANECLNAVLLDAGHAKPYDGGKR